ncbi:hypothetical protein P9K31_14200 [Corynebacterium glutamicum]|uniref:hypothetical protein n=1 Tax=Corynebacterium glutamicum TaxID=1718 RepID=UPI000721D4CB|nr:hypothetical protein [Corynebacterium glutamicum]ALP48878.1 hypothetical protein AC079_00755 [Corynebacterium glutamicum]ANU32410.1 hypothetical protein BBD29_00755 [Corynebacterium glutamicum]APT06154.1 hypothetical protein BSP99_00785 [Corynebacterium glutamicum]QWQ83071.1 hypothetical protein B5C28_00755 [Corynebacterium glutamicum]WFP71566.1 hypothetical protein P9K31_14200 [Corynebacterium glutamicum]
MLNNRLNTNSHLWCYITKFVSAYDSLPAAKQKYQEAVDRVRESHNVLLASEQAHNAGQTEPIFSLLLDEIVGFGEKLSEEEKENYSIFIFTTIVEVPENEEYEEKGDEEHPVVQIAAKIELDAEDDFPSVFPSRTRPIWMSETGRETSDCIFQ